MRPALYENDDVIAAGLEIEKSGRRVTGYALQSFLGGGKAARLLIVWNDYRDSGGDSEITIDLPEEVEVSLTKMTEGFVSQIRSLAASLNTVAVNTAEGKALININEAKDKQLAAEAELHDASLMVEELEEKLSSANETISDLRAKTVALDEVNKAQDKELTQLRLDNAVLSQQLNDSSDKIIDIKQDRQIIKDHLTSCEREIGELTTDKRHALESSNSANKQVEKLNKELSNTSEALVKAQSEVSGQKAKAEALQNQTINQEEQLKVFQAQLLELAKANKK